MTGRRRGRIYSGVTLLLLETEGCERVDSSTALQGLRISGGGGLDTVSNIRGNIQILRCVQIVHAAGRYGRSGGIRTDMTPGLPG
jgi:hypothetical protein